jgi:Fe-Mn family superoxide dismutase
MGEAEMSQSLDASRRELIQGAIAVSAAALITPRSAHAQTISTEKSTMSQQIAPAFTSQSVPKALGFDPAKLNGLSEKLIRSHYENNYGGSVKALAVVKKQLADALANKDTPPYIYNDLKREHLMRTGSVVLHEFYFDNLGGNGRPDATARTAISESFGDFDTWETEFRRIGLGLGGGSGWVLLGYNLHTQQIENYWLWDHLHGPPSTIPLLVMDMYEHSYQMDFGAATAKYIDAFFQNIRWEAVLVRLEQARKSATV